MLHKKQLFNITESICQWNTDRGNPRGTIDFQLEHNMLLEELTELNDATQDVDRLDALLDLHFVLTGSLHKLGLTPEQIVDAHQIVLNANQQKSANKSSSGKISKPADFQPPEPALQLILDKRPK